MNAFRHSVVCFRTKCFFKLKLLEQADTIVTCGLANYGGQYTSIHPK